MENKYYTPQIEEFRVGFEFEVDYGDNDWQQERINYAPEVVTLPYMKLENIRVKYLDSEDIESLGFIKTLQWLNNSNIYKKHPFFISLNDNKLTVFMQEKFDAVNGEILFHGNIKNRSELKVLLNQLGIK